MKFTLPELPYDRTALEPYISKNTIDFHYGKHHQTYVDNLNKLIKGTRFEDMELEEIIKETFGKSESTGIFNNAAQAWNHTFFWNSMNPNGGGEPKDELKQKIEKNFGSYDKFKEEFKTAAVGQFGSGWAWLVDDEGKLKVVKTSNADTPVAHGLKPFITVDIWEHAYYLDYQNRRADFVDAFLEHLVYWK
jgi:Fe-Mn family superoxide dismutase